MKTKITSVLLLLFSLFGMAQQEVAMPKKFVSLGGGLAVDAGWAVQKILDKNAYRDIAHFSYSASAQAGYRITNRLAVSTGIQYAYITPNFHPIYWRTHGYWFLGDVADVDFQFITVSFGKQMNHSSGRDIPVIGLGFGIGELTDSTLGHHFGFFWDTYIAENTIMMAGVTYNIMLFGKDKK